ncbi:rRNA maturation RNase YbeY [Dehalococcoides mccartyi]|uniref:rRNA maturation RNase YbeY n=1 Tax=Dehalococcoides mccartyi TaxID=61435 RepID=UPI0009900B56|nr:rRNA maturation RNase YbeY [Dehalococcoides mccartyi]AQU06355.1 rRNA maturation RNase YbeY [Dehalococcoides mccartyi]AQU07797.1 rRNA maturation RNase YbeY [Dehalococcoides mccartyi]
MEINVIVKPPFKKLVSAQFLKKIASETLKAQAANPSSELGIVITGQEEIKELNCKYRQLDEPTDVLSFYMLEENPENLTAPDDFPTPPDEATHLGEVIISYPQAELQAGAAGHSVNHELAFLLIHGVLHLLGYDHHETAAEAVMKSHQDIAMKHIREILK